MDGEGVVDGRGGEDVPHPQAARFQRERGHSRAARHVEPNRLAGRRKRRVWQRHAQRFGDHLRSCGRAQKLASAAWGSARAAAGVGSLFERDQVVGKTSADALHAPGIFAVFRGQRDAARNQNAGKIARAGQRHHHGRQTLVARRDSKHALARGQRTNEAAENGRRVVAVRQAVEHPRGALRAAIARVGAIGGERHRIARFQLFRCCLNEQVHFPMAGVIPERDRRTIASAQTAVRAEDQKFLAVELGRVPAHARILAPSEEVAGWAREQHFRSQRERALRTGGVCPDIKKMR